MVENAGCGFNRLRPYTSPHTAGRSHQLSYKTVSHLLSQASVSFDNRYYHLCLTKLQL